jgi:hypothetical protein
MIRRTLIRDHTNRSRVVVHLELREKDDAGNLSPAFGITSEVYEAHGTHSGKSRHLHDREPDSCGCLHDAALKAFPELAPLVTLHLADSETGEPMHAEANGRYFYRTACGLPGGWTDDYHHAEREGLSVEDYARRVACSILRVDVIPLDDAPAADLHAAFHEFVNDQRERWRREAVAGREQLEAIPTIYELRGFDVAGKPIERRTYPNCAEL